MNRILLLASFIFPERLEWFLDYLENKFNIPKEKVFIFENLDDESKVIVTFKLFLRNGKRINLKKHFPNAIPIHKKGTAIYTINALNRLIEEESDLELGNIDYKKHKIDWSNYQDSLILNNNGELNIYKIKRVFS